MIKAVNRKISLLRKFIWMLPMVIVSMFLTGCDHKELCMHHEHLVTIRVQFDWRYAPDATAGGMWVFFYNEDYDTPFTYNFNNTEGGYVSLPTGRYRILTYNNDTEFTLFDRKTGIENHMAYTRLGHVLEPITGPQTPEPVDDQDVVLCPDEIWTCSAIDVDITEDGVSYVCVPWEEGMDDIGQKVTTTEQVIYLYPHDVLCHYSYEVRNVDGLDRVEQICGALTGMSPSLALFEENLHHNPVTIPFNGKPNVDSATITGEFLTFGHHESNTTEHRLLLYVWMKDGKKYILGKDSEAFNVTQQVDLAPNRRRVHLIVDRVKIPDSSTPPDLPGNGQEASADEWVETNVDINI